MNQEEEELSSRSAPIWNGAPSLFSEAVQIQKVPGSQSCSGVIINPWWIQTAKHCEIPTTANVINSAGEIRHPACGYDHPDGSIDTKFIILDAAFSGYHQASYNWDASSNLVGQTVTCYGYGEGGPSGPAGVQRTADLVVSSASPTDIVLDSVLQQGAELGDSGGPCYLQNTLTLIGVIYANNHAPHRTWVVPSEAVRTWIYYSMFSPPADWGMGTASFATAPSVASMAEGKLNVAVTATDNSIWHKSDGGDPILTRRIWGIHGDLAC